MKFAMMALYVAAAFTATAAQASTVDLSTFSVTGAGSVASNYGVVTGTASISGAVSNLKSFEWNFTGGDYLPFDDKGFFITSGAGATTLASISTTPYNDDLGFSTGWQTYTLATPYSGSLTFGVANVGDDNNDSQLELRNVMAVPEPETYAMLLAGLGLVGLAKRRKARVA